MGKFSNQTKIIFFSIIAVIAVVIVVRAVPEPSARPPEAPPIAIIHITKSGFEPATLSVKQGTKVIWTNSEDTLHQIAANPYPKGTSLPGLKSEILNNAQ